MFFGVEVLHFAESKIREIGEGEEDGEGLLAEAVSSEHFGGFDYEHQKGEDVDGWDEEIDVPFPVFAANFDPNDDVPNWYECFPGGDADFAEDEEEAYDGAEDVDEGK